MKIEAKYYIKTVAHSGIRHFKNEMRAQGDLRMEKLIVVSDYIEGQPVVASVRYSGLMKYLTEHFSIITLNDLKYGEFKSAYSQVNFKFNTINSAFTQQLNDNVKKGRLQKVLRNKIVLSIWRNYKYSKYKFNKLNMSFYSEIDEYLRNNDVSAIFVTVPDVFGLYIIEFVKKKYQNIPVIIEIRDIINHEIGIGNPRYIFKKAEKIIFDHADGIIAVSQGIYDYYKEKNKDIDIRLIRNGYDEQYFIGCEYNSFCSINKEITLTHVGSIYKGRNIKDFINGLKLFCKQTGIKVNFSIVGVLDSEAIEDIQSIENEDDKVNINIFGSVKHERALQILKHSDVAVILTHKKGSQYAIPGKTYEYIGACKPILAVTEDKELVSFIHEKYGECASHNSAEIASSLIKLLQNDYDFSARFQYSRQNQAEEIVNYIKSKINRECHARELTFNKNTKSN